MSRCQKHISCPCHWSKESLNWSPICGVMSMDGHKYTLNGKGEFTICSLILVTDTHHKSHDFTIRHGMQGTASCWITVSVSFHYMQSRCVQMHADAQENNISPEIVQVILRMVPEVNRVSISPTFSSFVKKIPQYLFAIPHWATTSGPRKSGLWMEVVSKQRLKCMV
jgi:hypothetical protein